MSSADRTKMAGPARTHQYTHHPRFLPLPPPSSPLPTRPPFHPIDREKTCPLLLRVFTKIGSHHTIEDYAVRGKEPREEIQIYTWKDATLRELTDLVKDVSNAASRRDAKLSFAFVYPDKLGCYVVKPAPTTKLYNCGIFHGIMKKGMTYSYGNGRPLDEGKSLAEFGFQIGDFLDVAII